MPKRPFILTADKHMKVCVNAVLGRCRNIGINLGASEYDIAIEPGHDEGVFHNGHQSIRKYLSTHQHALLICDFHGSGGEKLAREGMEAQMEMRLAQNGWPDRSAAVVIDPELENWIWADSPHVETALGWQGRRPGLKDWLCSEGRWPKGQAKPTDPQSSLEVVLSMVGRPRTSALFQEVAERVSLNRCTDPAFLKLLSVLRQWFPAE